MKDGLIEIFKHANKDVEIPLIDLDNVGTPGLAFSSIVVAVRYKMASNSVAYHILTLEATGEKSSTGVRKHRWYPNRDRSILLSCS